MKHIMIVIPTLRMGGAEKALIALLKSLDSKKIKIDLFLFESGGVLQEDVPPWIKIIEADPITRAMTLEMRNYFVDILKRRKIIVAIDRLKMTFNSKRKKNYFSWNVIKKHILKVDNHYDVAIGFLEGFADFFVLDKIDADKKIGWIHTDMSGRIANEKEQNYYEKFDVIVTISEICKNAFVKLYTNIINKIQIIENIVLTNEILQKSN